MVENNSPLEIIVFSDYICPFCLIGYLTLKKLKEDYGDRISFNWKHYPLYPGTDKPYFSDDYILNVFEHVKNLVEERELDIEIVPPELPFMLPDSMKAFEASECARDQGKFWKFHEKVFEALFKEHKDIGNVEVLKEIAISVGMDVEKFENCLNNGSKREIIKQNFREGRSRGISGVPMFIIKNHAVIIGAEPYSLFKEEIDRALGLQGK
ncbi:MAG: DsbA family oxidoreductase [Candidatus Jordarchaeum sp.]|uniref:DsbA family oxidoreductase n=1 Tax=Candidatus Jordarchaeum sp. TaxID=2823881 RepID=UPI00404B96F8